MSDELAPICYCVHHPGERMVRRVLISSRSKAAEQWRCLKCESMDRYGKIPYRTEWRRVGLHTLPLGARFRYQNSKNLYVLVDRAGSGKVAAWKGNNHNPIIQERFLAADSREEFATLIVEVKEE